MNVLKGLSLTFFQKKGFPLTQMLGVATWTGKTQAGVAVKAEQNISAWKLGTTLANV